VAVGLALILLVSPWGRHAAPQPARPGPASSVSAAATPPSPAASAASEKAERLMVEVVATHPHDTVSYTQGLVWDRGALYESAGQYGQSSLRRVNLATGEVTRFAPVPREFFAEGLAAVGERLIQLTWREQTAFVYRTSDFHKLAELHYEGEGWGLCYDGLRLVSSDGSSRLTFRDPETLAPLGQVDVTEDGRPVDRLNELECAGGAIYANVYTEDRIVRIDPATGRVTAEIDASGLLTAEERAKGAEVLNGIAWNPATKLFLLTGKLWPKAFEVRFVSSAPPAR
jgi:glutamine cyclotransferase